MKLLLLTGTFRVGSQIPYTRRIRVASWGQSLLNLIMAAAWTESIRHLWFDIPPNPRPASVYLSAPLRSRDLLHSVITRLLSRPICLSLLCSLICPSAHSSPSIPPSINLAGRLLSCTSSLLSLRSHPSPPSICLSGLCKGQRRQRDIGWLMLLSSLTFLSLVRTHLHAEPRFSTIAWMGISFRIYNRLLWEMKMSRQIAAKQMSFHNVFIENNLSRDQINNYRCIVGV